MKIPFIFVLSAAFLSGFRCSLPWENRQPSTLTIVSYNAHNLFDDADDGGEYPEFKLNSGKWNTQLYKKRLESTAIAIQSFSPEGGQLPDIICLQEIEGEKVLKDLAAGPLRKGGYRWIAFGGPADSAVKCGILSRYAPESVNAHSLADAWDFGPARDMLEATFAFETGGPRLTIFICHWKSRREGEAETEVARRFASKLVAARIEEIAGAEPGRGIVVCGDFNESPDEFSRVGRKYPTAFMPGTLDVAGNEPESGKEVPKAWLEGVIHIARIPAAASLSDGEVALYSPWSGTDGFSYVFDDKEERLDGFLLSPSLVDGAGLEFSSFMVSDDPALLNDKGQPLKWSGSSGFSDHLPIELLIDFNVER